MTNRLPLKLYETSARQSKRAVKITFAKRQDSGPESQEGAPRRG